MWSKCYHFIWAKVLFCIPVLLFGRTFSYSLLILISGLLKNDLAWVAPLLTISSMTLTFLIDFNSMGLEVLPIFTYYLSYALSAPSACAVLRINKCTLPELSSAITPTDNYWDNDSGNFFLLLIILHICVTLYLIFQSALRLLPVSLTATLREL